MSSFHPLLPRKRHTLSTSAFFLGAGAAAAPPATDCRRKVKSFSFITPAAAGTPAAALGGANARDLPAGALS